MRVAGIRASARNGNGGRVGLRRVGCSGGHSATSKRPSLTPRHVRTCVRGSWYRAESSSFMKGRNGSRLRTSE